MSPSVHGDRAKHMVERQTSSTEPLDASLRRLFDPPPPQRFDAIVADARRTLERRGPGRRLRRLAVAAAIAGGLIGGWLIVDASGRLSGRRGYEPPPWRSFETVYRDEIAAGFQPRWVCETDEEFAATFGDRFGQKLLLAQLPDEIQAVGLSYAHTLTRRTIHLLAQVQGQPVLVFVDQPGRGGEAAMTQAGGLSLHRRQLGRLVLFELSPFDEPLLLGGFYDPDAPGRPSAERNAEGESP